MISRLATLQNRRRGLIGVQCLPFLGRHRRHRAGHRRVNFGETEIGAVALKVGFGFLNLRGDRVDLGSGHGRLGFRFLQCLLADSVDGDQILIALQILFGQRPLGLLLVELRLADYLARFVCLYLGLVDARVDLGKQFAFSHGIADIDMDFLELAGYLGADVDILLRFQLALRGDDFFKVTATDRDRLNDFAL